MRMFRLSPPSRLLQIVITMLALSGSLGAATYKILYNFGLSPDSSGPGASVTLDSHGNLFGTTLGGGVFGDGTVFELTYSPDTGWTETTLHSFTYKVYGENPDGMLTLDPSGNLYGTTPFRGPQLVGTVF